MIALVVTTAVLVLVLWVALYGDESCGYRDEASAWECGLRVGHSVGHGLWLKDERGDAIFRR